MSSTGLSEVSWFPLDPRASPCGTPVPTGGLPGSGTRSGFPLAAGPRPHSHSALFSCSLVLPARQTSCRKEVGTAVCGVSWGHTLWRGAKVLSPVSASELHPQVQLTAVGGRGPALGQESGGCEKPAAGPAQRQPPEPHSRGGLTVSVQMTQVPPREDSWEMLCIQPPWQVPVTVHMATWLLLPQ